MRAEWLGAALAGTRLGFHVRDVLLRVLPARERAGQLVATASGEQCGCSPRQRCGLHGGLEARRHLRSAVRVPVSPAPEEAARGGEEPPAQRQPAAGAAAVAAAGRSRPLVGLQATGCASKLPQVVLAKSAAGNASSGRSQIRLAEVECSHLSPHGEPCDSQKCVPWGTSNLGPTQTHYPPQYCSACTLSHCGARPRPPPVCRPDRQPTRNRRLCLCSFCAAAPAGLMTLERLGGALGQ